MNKEKASLYFALIRYAVLGEPLSEEARKLAEGGGLEWLYSLGKIHDIAHLLAYSLEENGLLPDSDVAEKFKKERMVAVYRNMRMKGEYERITGALSSAKINFIPLKGSVIRKYYPEAWMRTSCDIDILIKKCDIPDAVRTLSESLGFSAEAEGTHDVSLFSKSGVHLELHFDLNEPSGKCYSNLKDPWSFASPIEEGSCLFVLDDAYLAFYHIAHMAKHFIKGGCGVRPFIDLYLLRDVIDKCRDEYERLLSEDELLKFAREAEHLSLVWLGGEAHTNISINMENYVLKGGTYGTTDNKVVLQSAKKGSRFKYAISRIILPYNIIRYHYPILERHRWLTPVMQVRRWFKLVFCGGIRRSANELRMSREVSSEQLESAESLLESIGL